MEFLKAITSKEARRLVDAFPVSPEAESLPMEDAYERVLAEDIVSAQDLPQFPRSLVDGYALKAKDTYGAKETNPALLSTKGEVQVGEKTDMVLEEGSSIYVNTGSMVPEGADGVVMQEFVRRADDEIEVTRSISKGENICFQGEDIQEGSKVLSKGERLTPFHMGTLAALGVSRVPVFKKPVISLISSGNEIHGIEGELPPGKVRDINRYTISGLLKRQGALVSFEGVARDDPAEITSKLLASRESCMILISGGSSKGERDFVSDSITGLGGTILFHGVNIKPGKPTIFAELWQKPVFGLPGHPASCALAAIRFVLPLTARLTGETSCRQNRVTATLTTNAPSSYGVEEYVRVSLKEEPGRWSATPVFSKSAIISSLSAASGYVVIPEGSEGLERGEQVEVYLF